MGFHSLWNSSVVQMSHVPVRNNMIILVKMSSYFQKIHTPGWTPVCIHSSALFVVAIVVVLIQKNRTKEIFKKNPPHNTWPSNMISALFMITQWLMVFNHITWMIFSSQCPGIAPPPCGYVRAHRLLNYNSQFCHLWGHWAPKRVQEASAHRWHQRVLLLDCKLHLWHGNVIFRKLVTILKTMCST